MFYPIISEKPNFSWYQGYFKTKRKKIWKPENPKITIVSNIFFQDHITYSFSSYVKSYLRINISSTCLSFPYILILIFNKYFYVISHQTPIFPKPYPRKIIFMIWNVNIHPHKNQKKKSKQENPKISIKTQNFLPFFERHFLFNFKL